MRVGAFRGITLTACVLCAISIWAQGARAVDISGMVEDSDAIDSARRNHSSRPFSLMFNSSFQSPGLDNLDSHLNKMDMIPQGSGAAGTGRHSRSASASSSDAGASGSSESHGGHQPGYRLRHSLAANYEFSPGYLLGPAVDVSEPFSGRHQGDLSLEDPLLRFTILELYQARIGQNNLHSNMMISASFPTSENSRRRSSWGGLSISSSPRMHFRGTPYSLMGTCSVRTGMYGRSDAGPLINARVTTGVQGGYRISRRLESGLMFHAGSEFGPNIPMPDADGFMKDRGTQIFGLMPSLRYQLNTMVSLTPRLDWYLDQPIHTTTFSLSAMMRLI
jgi:hypothetical protein